jgi:hypothetical protein
MGAYMDYPHRICKKGVAGKLVAPAKLMDAAFAKGGVLDALELDAQPAPEAAKDDPELYVVHDPLESDLEPSRYASASLSKLLEHFRANYAGQKKHLYIELKAQRACNGEKLVTWYDEELVAKRMMAILKKFPSILQDITLTSFNPRALVEAHAQEGELGGAQLRYTLIVGGAGFWKGDVVCWIGMNDIPTFRSDREILKAPWLTGLWFAPTVLADWDETLEGINKEREKGGSKPLRFGLSTYNYEWKDFEAQLTSSKVRLANVESLIYDVCDGTNCKAEVEDVDDCSHSDW